MLRIASSQGYSPVSAMVALGIATDHRAYIVAHLPDPVDLYLEAHFVDSVTDRRVPSTMWQWFSAQPIGRRALRRRNAIPDYVAQSAEFAGELAGLSEVDLRTTPTLSRRSGTRNG